jgi:hypothetical protein
VGPHNQKEPSQKVISVVWGQKRNEGVIKRRKGEKAATALRRI